jgi:hypothetical protein
MLIFNRDETSLKYLSSNFNIEITKYVVHLQIKMYKNLFILMDKFFIDFLLFKVYYLINNGEEICTNI